MLSEQQFKIGKYANGEPQLDRKNYSDAIYCLVFPALMACYSHSQRRRCYVGVRMLQISSSNVRSSSSRYEELCCVRACESESNKQFGIRGSLADTLHRNGLIFSSSLSTFSPSFVLFIAISLSFFLSFVQTHTRKVYVAIQLTLYKTHLKGIFFISCIQQFASLNSAA